MLAWSGSRGQSKRQPLFWDGDFLRAFIPVDTALYVVCVLLCEPVCVQPSPTGSSAKGRAGPRPPPQGLSMVVRASVGLPLA